VPIASSRRLTVNLLPLSFGLSSHEMSFTAYVLVVFSRLPSSIGFQPARLCLTAPSLPLSLVVPASLCFADKRFVMLIPPVSSQFFALCHPVSFVLSSHEMSFIAYVLAVFSRPPPSSSSLSSSLFCDL